MGSSFKTLDFDHNDPDSWKNCGWKQQYTDTVNKTAVYMFNIVKQLTGCKLISNCCDIVANGSGMYGSHSDFGMPSIKTKSNNKWYDNRYLPWFLMFQIFCDDKWIHLAMKRKEIF